VLPGTFGYWGLKRDPRRGREKRSDHAILDDGRRGPKTTRLIGTAKCRQPLSKETISTSIETARRLAVTKQRLAGKLQARSPSEAIVSVVRDLGYVQWDPINVVAPSHVIALWNRVPNFRMSDLDRLLWDEKKLFEHWSHAASIVPTEDYPLHYSLMRRYPESLSKSWGGWKVRARKFLAEHSELRKKILSQLAAGPLRVGEFQDHVRGKKSADGWSSGSDVTTMLFHLQMSGAVMVVGHHGNQNIWGLSDQFLPNWVERKELTADEAEQEGARRTIRALGIASPSDINLYFLRGRYLNLKKALERLLEESAIHPVHVEGLEGRGERYVDDRDVGLLDDVSTDAWEPRMSLLPPFDNLIIVRGWTKRMFGFDHLLELFFPESKRKFGYYVLPILWGDRFIGRVDPRMDRAREKLLINSVHAELGAPGDKDVSATIGDTIERFAKFLGVKEVEYTSHVPKAWRKSLH
jgi:uncharacterized protein YcaQ